MAKTSYGKAGILNILLGASFLGAGGGGAYNLGVTILDMLESEGHLLQLDTISVGDAAPDEYAAMVAGLGAPSNVVMAKFEQDLPGAFAALQEACRVDGKTLTYLYSGEMGGLNTMVPIMLHIVSSSDPASRTPILDVDANGRAVPELNTCLVSARGTPPSPVGIQGHNLNNTGLECRYLAWTQKYSSESSDVIAKRAESIARSLAIEFGQVGFSTWAVPSPSLATNACPGYLSIAHGIGNALQLGTPYSEEKLSQIAAQLGGKAKTLCVGTVKKFTRDVSAGFDVGSTTIEGDDGIIYNIDFQNENIVAYSAGTSVITVPERITILDYTTCQPLTNVEEDIHTGKRVAVIISASHENWWAPDCNAYRCWNPILDRVNYSEAFIDYDGTSHARA